MTSQTGTLKDNIHNFCRVPVTTSFLTLAALICVSCSERLRTYNDRVMECWNVEYIAPSASNRLVLSTTVIYLANEAPISAAEKCPGESMTVDFDRNMILPFVDNEEALSLGSKAIPVFDVIVEGEVDEMASNEFNIEFSVEKMKSAKRNTKLTAEDVMDTALGR